MRIWTFLVVMLVALPISGAICKDAQPYQPAMALSTWIVPLDDVESNWQARPRSVFITLALQANDSIATVNASWTHPQAAQMSFPWYVQGDSLAANGTTLETSVSYDRARVDVDVTESFCVLARRVRDGKESNAVCQAYTIPALAVEEPPPPPPDSVDVTVDTPPGSVPEAPQSEELADGSVRWTWLAADGADDYTWSAGGGRSGSTAQISVTLDPAFADESDRFFCVSARNSVGESPARCNSYTPSTPPSAFMLDSLTTHPEAFTIYLPDSTGVARDSLGNDLPMSQRMVAIGWVDEQSLWCEGLWYEAVQDAAGEWQQGTTLAYAEPCAIDWCSTNVAVASVSKGGVDQGQCDEAGLRVYFADGG